MRTGLHVCRGNWSRNESTLLSGSYHPLSPWLARVPVDQLVLEYATERAGGLLDFRGKELGLGVVNPRTDRVETSAEIAARVREALTMYSPERLFLNPDCGFATFANRAVGEQDVATRKLRWCRLRARCARSSAVEAPRWTVRVRATAEGGSTVLARTHHFDVGEPAPFDLAAPRVSGLEYALGALGAELSAGLLARARREGRAIDEAEAVVGCELDDPLAALGVIGATGHAGIGRLTVKVFARTFEPPEVVAALWRATLAASPLCVTLAKACTLETACEIAP
jgi:hypothetical protein